MRGPTRTLIGLFFVVSLVGCGGAAGAGGGGTTAAQAPDPCPADNEVRLGRICWNPTGSRWHLTAQAPGGEYAFDVELLPANRLRSTDHPAATAATDEWFVDGNSLRLFLQDRFVEYRADLTNGTVMVGEAQNVRGEGWSWRGDRMQLGGGCHPGEAVSGETCITLAGTQWRLRGPGGERVIHFEHEGQLLTDQGAPVEAHRWTQEGDQLRFTLDGVEYTAPIESAERLSGTANGAQWSAELVPLYPPPMH
ncbi:MAG: hypothetical protein M3Y87_08375 [Myxococcota bacterium]|nr:hypothetical protein [Myxococcota bacterium]